MNSLDIIITGGFGFIGSALARHCLSLGHRVLVLDKMTYASNINSIPQHQNLFSRRVAIEDRERIKEAFLAFSPDVVFHLAAESHVDNSIRAAGVFFETNVIGTWSMLEVFREYYSGALGTRKPSPRFVHVSTDEVFGETTPESAGFNEDTRYDPKSPYAASKAGSDHVASSFRHTYSLPISITNCCNNYGPWQHKEKLLPKAIVNTIVDGSCVPVYGKGDQYRQWLYVDDHVEALMAVLSLDSGNYMIGGDTFATNLEILHSLDAAVKEVSGKGLVLEHVTDRPGHDKCYKVDDSTFRKLSGWTPKTGLRDGLLTTVKHVMSQHNLA